MGYIDWNEVIRDVQNISKTKLKQYEVMLQHTLNRTNMDNAALIAIQAELERRNGV